MAYLKQYNGENNDREHNENGSEGRGGLIEGAEHIATALEHIAQIAQAQHKRSQSYTSVHTSSILAPGNLMLDLHLPQEMALGSAFIENYATTAVLTLYEGSSPGGRFIGQVKGGQYKLINLADHISSISITASAADNTGLVVVTLSTHRFGPKTGTL